MFKQRKEEIKGTILSHQNFCEDYPDSYLEEGKIGFNHNGQQIHNPFMDESNRFPVVPWEYYSWDELEEWVESMEQYAADYSLKNTDVFLEIIDRATRLADINIKGFDRMGYIMDLTCAGITFEMRWEDMLKADKFNFMHDFWGIQDNIVRDYYPTTDFQYFVPRFAGRSKTL